MPGFLLDTNVISELTKRRPNARVVAWIDATPEDSLYLSVITLGEVRIGIEMLDDGNPARAARGVAVFNPWAAAKGAVALATTGAVRAWQDGGRSDSLSDPLTGVQIEDWSAISKLGRLIGPDHPAVLIVEFGDYECPACRELQRRTQRLNASFGDRIVAADVRIGEEFEVWKTPTLVINGLRIDGLPPFDRLEALVSRAANNEEQVRR